MARTYSSDTDTTCRLCGKVFSGLAYLGGHIKRSHNMERRDYYDKFFRRELEGYCRVCGKPTKFEKLSIGYNRYCSVRCAARDEQKKINAQMSIREKYGVDHIMQCPEIKKRVRETNLKKYGGPSPMSSEEVMERFRKSMTTKHGVWVTKTKEYKEKVRQTSLERYGVSSPNKSEEVKKKQQETLKTHYGENPWVNPQILEKRKETCRRRYGVDFYMQTKEYKVKTEKTCRERYGVRNPMQNREVIERWMANRKDKVEIDGTVYDSLWEFKYKQYLDANNISYVFHPDIFFWYHFQGKAYRYYPDFIVRQSTRQESVVEVKGDYLAKGMAKEGTKANAKWKCMMANGVKVLFGQELKDLGIDGIRLDNSIETMKALKKLRGDMMP